jgi:coproporphyrinogen III oxidase
MDTTIDQAASYFLDLQDAITNGLAAADGTAFHEDRWEYAGKGGGRSRVLSEGQLFEKAGVNFSDVSGEFSDEFAGQMPGHGKAFRATGVSLVLHPWNPYTPTVHANWRCIRRGDYTWFGGGADLTPNYPFKEDCVHFHRVWRDVCHRHPLVAHHDRFKAWCDEYFFIKHRGEARGVGGIFFDWLHSATEAGLGRALAFVRDCGDHFLESYLPIVERRRTLEYGERQRDWQLVRRGRYVEFNLVYDRGTVFGLKTGGRIESILMSLPLNAKWVYNHKPEPGSPEAECLEFLKPRDWHNEPA